ncbi:MULTISPECIES: multicopper oxidase family protein [Bacillus]|uniref:multicopper oxidase family protein n=1 Tax=Bacillus TaxID=1386 RepID=UPI00039D07E5|nr:MULTISPECIES: multicopper oxidase [Bacillus]ETB72519.1 copper oxidase [Bacillus sp. CPSM8]KUL15363.1 copper oxidase [Bacillus licheniformis LMG 6934]MCY1631409.1 multicopper oxidase [Bacillus paralicheniformis]MDE1385393.1 multicopper oxidase [Bacillus paralicheniformis]OMI12851.1 copper oxidase [Bacillus paralicheniformis]
MKLEKFVDKLPIPKVLKPHSKSKEMTYYEVTMKEFQQQLHRDLPPTRLFGYNGVYPGPTFEVQKHEKVAVKWLNKLPDHHFLPVDHTIHDDGHHEHEVKTVVHLHGGRTPPDSDGYPEAWYTKDFQVKGPFFEREVYEYPNEQDATALWYHDHAMAITRLNVYAGLVGLYFIRDREERSLNLPKGEYEIPLLIQDKSFHEDGSLFYPQQPDNPSPDLPDPSIVPAFCGDTILVNGKVWPYDELEPRKYRFRILNASNTRIFELYFDHDITFHQIGTDGGLLQHPVKVNELVIAPAERCDIIVDFSRAEGKTVTLKNRIGCGGQDADPDTDADIMQFRISKPLKQKDTSSLPRILRKRPFYRRHKINTLRNLSLGASLDQYGRPVLLLNNTKWHEPVTETPALGSTEIWSIINAGRAIHPIHLHLVQFLILDHRPFDIERYQENGELVFTGPAAPPAQNEKGLKDTVKVPPGSVTRIIATFAPYSGRYVWHCHILEHEDYDMMRPLEVTDIRHQ